MPNWCECYLKADGPNAKLFLEKFREHGFNSVLSDPNPYDYSQDAEDWRIAAWGTKWNVNWDDGAQMDLDALRCKFLTAWGPPTGWLVAVAASRWVDAKTGDVIKDRPDLRLSMFYVEAGMQFFGMMHVEDGVIHEVYYDGLHYPDADSDEDYASASNEESWIQEWYDGDTPAVEFARSKGLVLTISNLAEWHERQVWELQKMNAVFKTIQSKANLDAGLEDAD